MTVIAAAVDLNGTIYMGGDTITLIGDCVRIDRRSKVFCVGPFLVGATGPHRICQIFEYSFEPPAVSGSDLTAYMVRDFIPALRQCLEEQGAEVKHNDQRQIEAGGGCLIGIDGQLFSVDVGYGVFGPRAPYHAIGCAAQEAIAAMFTARTLIEGIGAKRIVQCGLEAAAEFDINIRPPFTVLSLESHAKHKPGVCDKE